MFGVNSPASQFNGCGTCNGDAEEGVAAAAADCVCGSHALRQGMTVCAAVRWDPAQSFIVPPSLQAQGGGDTGFNFPWYIWLVISLAFSIALTLVICTLIYIFYNCAKSVT